jgi:hypothetical protein
VFALLFARGRGVGHTALLLRFYLLLTRLMFAGYLLSSESEISFEITN